ncbi:MAG: hypothetical protein A2144_03885 [Chloroflexi bacterium RBG_16_50_9]|nr:MAG: hypothetical protein A2144_03885 [Chloroflexi bacterium RBG_16_50_9]
MLVSGITLVVFIVYIALFVIFRWEPRIAMGLAVISILASAITYSTGKLEPINQFSVYASGALVSGVIIALVLNIRNSREDK